MLVLTRKLNEEILIGDDIRITLTRITGNTVRLGIEAPRDVRIIRGELGPREEALDNLPGGGPQISSREEAFAHPRESTDEGRSVNRMNQLIKPQVFVGTVKRNGDDPQLSRAPLAAFVSAS